MDSPASETDIQAARTPAIVRTAGGVALGAGALAILISVRGGLVSLFAMAEPIAALAALALSASSLAPCKRVTEARARLAAQGLNLGM